MLVVVFGWANQPPRAESSIFYGEMNRPLEIALLAQDPEGEPLKFELLDQPSRGKLLGAPPHLIYWPDKDFVGTERFSFRVIDPYGAFDIGFVEIRISPSFASLRILPDVPSLPSFAKLVEFLVGQGVRTWYVLDIEPRAFAPGSLPFVFAGAGREARLLLVGPAEDPEIQEISSVSGLVFVDFQRAQPGIYLLLLVSGTEAFSYPVRIVNPVLDRKLALGG
ncbi:MAG: Ig-like domain-containing protein [Clostridia bacterium]|nr:Ig-like domain-containing protein [Clostridia bacterium]